VAGTSKRDFGARDRWHIGADLDFCCDSHRHCRNCLRLAIIKSVSDRSMDIRVDWTILKATTKLQTINLSYRRGEVVYEKGAPAQFGYLVTEGCKRSVAKYSGLAKTSVWHGSADRTVKPSNAGEIIKQWLNVHELPSTPMSEQNRRIESFTIAGMAHGAPISSLVSGIAGPCRIEAGFSSSDHIAEFFGLDEPRIEGPA
jgi:hypothetical protein